MIDETTRKQLVLDHSRRLTAGDVDGLLDLYADDVSFEDPVGSGVRTGRAALREHVERLVAARVREVPGEPVAGQDHQHALVPVSAVSDYEPDGPGYAGRGWVPAAVDPRAARLHREYVLQLRVDPDGRIAAMRAYWGAADAEVHEPGRAPARGSSTAAETMARRAEQYARRMNDGDVDAVLAMFSDDIVFEDPVGATPLRGLDQLRTRIAWSIGCKVHETPGRSVSSVDGRRLVVPSSVSVFLPTRVTFRIVGVMEFGADGLTRHVQAFWGVTDTSIGDGPQRTGVAHAMTVNHHLAAMAEMAGGDARPT